MAAARQLILAFHFMGKAKYIIRDVRMKFGTQVSHTHETNYILLMKLWVKQYARDDDAKLWS